MSDLLSILLLNGDSETSSQFEKLADAQLATASLTSDRWTDTLRNHALDILVVELSTKNDLSSSLSRIERLHLEFPDLSIFVTSSSKAPELIIGAMRAGAQEFLTKPINEHELFQAVDRSRRRKQMSSGNPRGKLISIFSKTGGSGVTTLAVNLGVALARESKRAALVDLNFQHGDAASFLNLAPRYSIIDACESEDQVDSHKLQSCMAPHLSGLSILAEPPHLAASNEVTVRHTQAVLQQLQANYPYVVVDTPHMFEPRIVAALDLSSTILLTTVATIPALRSARKSLACFRELGYSSEKVKLVINRVSKNDRIEIKEIAHTLDYQTFWTLPNNFPAVSDALNTGSPLVLQKRLTNIGKSILEMAKTVHQIGNNGSH